MKYRVTHTTTYSGSEQVSVGHNEARLKPRDCIGQTRLNHQLKISPKPTSLTERIDYYGNPAASFTFSQGYDELVVTSQGEIVVDERPPRPVQSPSWNQVVSDVRMHRTPLEIEAYEYSFCSPMSNFFDALKTYGGETFSKNRPILDGVEELTSRIFSEFKYDPRATTVTTAVPEVFELRRGVCQDFAHLQIAALRSLGIPARYVSGYLRTYPPPGKPRMIGADASHAWLSVYCGAEIGWIDVDPTNNKFTSTDHITIAWGRDYGDVIPLKGVYTGGGQNTLTVNVDVAPLE